MKNSRKKIHRDAIIQRSFITINIIVITFHNNRENTHTYIPVNKIGEREEILYLSVDPKVFIQRRLTPLRRLLRRLKREMPTDKTCLLNKKVVQDCL